MLGLLKAKRQRLGKGGGCGPLVAGDLRVCRRARRGDEGGARGRSSLPFFFWAAVLGWRRLAPARTRRPLPFTGAFSFCLARRDRRVQLEPLRQRLRDRLRQGGEQVHDAARRSGWADAPGVAGEGDPLVLPCALAVACSARGLSGGATAPARWRFSRRAPLWLLLISRYYQWYGGGSWGPRFLVPLLPLWILPAAEIFLALAAAGQGLAGGDRPRGRRQPRRLDDPVAGAVRRVWSAARLVGARRVRSRLERRRSHPCCMRSSTCRRQSLRRRRRSSLGRMRSERPAGRSPGRGSPTSLSSTTARTRCSSGRAAASCSRRWRSRSLALVGAARGRRSLRRRCCRARRSSCWPR